MDLVGDLEAVTTALIGLIVVYLVAGAVLDAVRAHRLRATTRARAQLVSVLLADDEPAGEAAERLSRAEVSVLLPLAQRLAADLDGDADQRLRRLIGTAGLTHEITRRLRSRRWRRRAQAAALAPLLPADDPRRLTLLRDPHPIVRARAALHLDTEDTIAAAGILLELLGDESSAVRFAAQQALLRADGRIVEPLIAVLGEPDHPGIGLALEVAASVPDHRLQPAVRALTASPDAAVRALATAALLDNGLSLQRLRWNLNDEDPGVRAAATEAIGRLGALTLAPLVGQRLGDRSWTVRVAAGRSLATLGAVGCLILRHHLLDDDPYGRDMARRALDDIEARDHRPVVPARIPAGLDPWPADGSAA